MADAAIDPLAWLDELPAEYAVQVVPPIRYESHEDGLAHARMVVGLDAQGQRCYLRHTHTVTEDRFDIDEFPLEVAVLRERLRPLQWAAVGVAAAGVSYLTIAVGTESVISLITVFRIRYSWTDPKALIRLMPWTMHAPCWG